MAEQQIDMLEQESIDPRVLDNISSLPYDSREWPTLLHELLGVTHKSLKQSGIEDIETALKVVLDLGEYMGGVQIYLPRGDRLKQQIRDMKIYNEFNGSNIRQLAYRYHLTEKAIYEIIAKMRKIESKRRQPDLFE